MCCWQSLSQMQQATTQRGAQAAAASRSRTWHSQACTGAPPQVRVTSGRIPHLGGQHGLICPLTHVSLAVVDVVLPRHTASAHCLPHHQPTTHSSCPQLRALLLPSVLLSTTCTAMTCVSSRAGYACSQRGLAHHEVTLESPHAAIMLVSAAVTHFVS
jgi:hypothetical protein